MVAEIDKAQAAYDEWKKEHKLMLKVYTDEEIFKIGFWLGSKSAADQLITMMDSKKRKTKAK